MENTRFLKSLLGTRGFYCIVGLKDKSRKQKFFETIKEAAQGAETLSQMGYDAYFALATFREDTSRKADNALQMGSLFIDLDCGEGKDYPDQVSALNALRRFVVDMGIPKPLMVSSGYGIHAYWPLSAPVPVSKWKPVAEALKRTCVSRNLFIDPAVPADAARILRVPGTNNYKRGSVQPVEVLGKGNFEAHSIEHYADIFGAEDEAPTVPATLFGNTGVSAKDDPVMQRLMGARKNFFKRILQKTMAGNGCEQLRQIVLDQANTEEPLWRAGLSIAAQCEDGEKAAHVISHEHPDYSPRETLRKMREIKGPYTCDTFDSLRGGICDSCPLKGKIKSPIVLGAEVVEDKVEEHSEPEVILRGPVKIPQLPFGYMISSGSIYKIEKKEKDDDRSDEDRTTLVYLNIFYYTSRVLDPELGECVVGRLHLPKDGVREFTIPLVAATSKEELRKALSKNGVSVNAKLWDGVMAYTNAWIEKLQEEDAADNARTQFGWSDDTMTSYVIGDREIFADRVEYNPPSSKTAWMFPALKKHGTLEGWIEQAEFYNREDLEPYQFVICQALAAPLMRLTPVHAAIFDFYSDGSGHGKSTTQNFAATIYGHPPSLVMGPKDTLNARLNRMELMKDVNVQFDEFTEFPAENTSELIYEITSGRQKARMASGSNEERYRGDPWSTTVTSSSNYSMLAKVYASKSNPQAETQRVLRYHVQPHNFTSKNETDVFAKSVGEHRGHAIEAFVQYVIANMQTVKELLDKVQRKLDTACNLTMKNRFWSAQGAVTITALIIAKEIGLLNYDVKRLFNWTVSLIRDNKHAALDSVSAIESVITEYVAEHYGEILWIKSDHSSDSNNGNGLDNLVVPELNPRGRLAARYETDTKMLYLVLGPLKSWCARRKLNYDSVKKEAIAKFGGEKKKFRISAGTKLRLPSVDVLALDCSQLDLEAGDGRSKGR